MSYSSPDCRTGQNKADIAKKSSHSYIFLMKFLLYTFYKKCPKFYTTSGNIWHSSGGIFIWKLKFTIGFGKISSQISQCVVEVINPPTPRAAHPPLHQKNSEEVSRRKSKKEGRKEIREEKIITDKSEENIHKKGFAETQGQKFLGLGQNVRKVQNLNKIEVRK